MNSFIFFNSLNAILIFILKNHVAIYLVNTTTILQIARYAGESTAGDTHGHFFNSRTNKAHLSPRASSSCVKLVKMISAGAAESRGVWAGRRQHPRENPIFSACNCNCKSDSGGHLWLRFTSVGIQTQYLFWF
jgi:hypothetical protein